MIDQAKGALAGWKAARQAKKELKAKKEPSNEAKVYKRVQDPLMGAGVICMVLVTVILFDYPVVVKEMGRDPGVMFLISKWQTLLTGVCAIMGATLTVRAVIVQTGSAERAEQHRLKVAADLDQRNCERDLLAARSVMPLTLTVLGEYTTAIAMAAHTVLQSITPGQRKVRAVDNMPPLAKAPASIIADLQAFIRAAPTEAGSAVADVLSDLQILSANAENTWRRAKAGGGEIVMPADFEALVGRAAVLHARITGLFPYARRSVKAPPAAPLPVHVDYALRLWVVAPSRYPGYVLAADAFLNAAVAPDL